MPVIKCIWISLNTESESTKKRVCIEVVNRKSLGAWESIFQPSWDYSNFQETYNGICTSWTAWILVIVNRTHAKHDVRHYNMKERTWNIEIIIFKIKNRK